MWAAGLFIGALYFGPSIMSSVRSAIVTRQAQPQAAASTAAAQKAQAKRAGDRASGTSATSPDPQAALSTGLAGTWQGRAALNDRGVCQISLELRELPDKENDYAANSSLSCTPTVMELLSRSKGMNSAGAMDTMGKAMSPTSAILTGNQANGSIHFHVDKNIGVEQVPGGCEMTSLSVTPFGASRILIEWHETDQGSCRGGQIIAAKGR
jgi:hypothetical protein